MLLGASGIHAHWSGGVKNHICPPETFLSARMFPAVAVAADRVPKFILPAK